MYLLSFMILPTMNTNAITDYCTAGHCSVQVLHAAAREPFPRVRFLGQDARPDLTDETSMGIHPQQHKDQRTEQTTPIHFAGVFNVLGVIVFPIGAGQEGHDQTNDKTYDQPDEVEQHQFDVVLDGAVYRQAGRNHGDDTQDNLAND